MIQRVIKLFWLAMLAMVLPTQAVAYFAQAESDISARLDRSKQASQSLSKAASQALFETTRDEHDSDSQPVSQSEGQVDVVAIIHLNRWGVSGRWLEEADNNPSDEFSAPSGSLPPRKLYCHPVVQTLAYWAKSDFTANHRISGWKDSNALYVALNSQFA